MYSLYFNILINQSSFTLGKLIENYTKNIMVLISADGRFFGALDFFLWSQNLFSWDANYL